MSEYDEKNKEIISKFTKSRMELLTVGVPLVGDLVQWPNNTIRRISHVWGNSLQTSFSGAGSFFVYGNGYVSFSGSLQPDVLADFFKPTDVIQEANGFWFFSHNIAGPGRGISCKLPTRLWKLEPFTRTRQEAEKHPRAIEALEFWGEGDLQYERVLEEIMHPRVLANPDYF